MNPEGLLLAERLITTPEPPTSMRPEEKSLWQNIVPRLVKLRIITRMDLLALEVFCYAYHRYQIETDATERYEFWKICRVWLYKFLLISEQDINAREYDQTSEDPDLAHWFAPLSDDERWSAAHE